MSASTFQPEGVHGPSMVVNPASFPWTDEAFTGHALADLVIYELHVGTFTAAGTFEAIVPHLPNLVELGVTAVELMPVAEFPGSRNWGYDGVHLFAAQSTYGGPRGLRRLVDACHAHGLSVILDVVYNHLGPEGNYLGEFGPYFTDRYRTPWGGAVNFDGPEAEGVRRHFVENARAWVRECHGDWRRRWPKALRSRASTPNISAATAARPAPTCRASVSSSACRTTTRSATAPRATA